MNQEEWVDIPSLFAFDEVDYVAGTICRACKGTGNAPYHIVIRYPDGTSERVRCPLCCGMGSSPSYVIRRRKSPSPALDRKAIDALHELWRRYGKA